MKEWAKIPPFLEVVLTGNSGNGEDRRALFTFGEKKEDVRRVPIINLPFQIEREVNVASLTFGEGREGHR